MTEIKGYKNYRWIVADPQLLGGRLAVRGTRFSVSFLLACLAEALFSESAAKSLTRHPGFGVVLVTISQMRGPEFLAAFEHAWGEAPIQPIAGQVVQWPNP